MVKGRADFVYASSAWYKSAFSDTDTYFLYMSYELSYIVPY